MKTIIRLIAVAVMICLTAMLSACRSDKNEAGATNTPEASATAPISTAAPAPKVTPGELKSVAAGTNLDAEEWRAFELNFSGKLENDNSVSMNKAAMDFETDSVPPEWQVFGGTGKLSVSKGQAHGGSGSLCYSDRSNSWSSPVFNLYKTFKDNGPGLYKISFWIYGDNIASNAIFNVIVRGSSASDANSFIKAQNNNFYTTFINGAKLPQKTWTQVTTSITVVESDLSRPSGDFLLMIGSLNHASGQILYFDDFKIEKSKYGSLFSDIKMDVVFTGPDNTTMTMPSFWDGDNVWKVRFAPTKAGKWSYSSVCEDPQIEGLHNIKGEVNVAAYSGPLEIFKHGFVRTAPNVKYFMYNDGTPFFYLGDTHWILPHEKFDTSNVSAIKSQFKYIVDKRVEQRFTVYQSEPIQTSHGGNDEAVYNLADGLTDADIAGFHNLDRKFHYIAESGLVHANSQLFFADELKSKASAYSAPYLEALSRYWVARYAAYPVLWTTAQEVDKRGPELWKTVLTSVYKHDPYKHPATAHQENALIVKASDSVYRDMPEHTWYSPQWKDYVWDKKTMVDFKVPRDYWEKGQGKPVINYEGCYEDFYTDRQGVRVQGWIAYLNGMYGHGYGAAGLWNDIYAESDYGSGYLIEGDNPSTNFMKYFKTWDQGVALKGADDMGRMHEFFARLEWWKLTPRFDSKEWSSMMSWYALASSGNDVYVAYLYNPNTLTGTINGMANVPYSAQWFNPSTGEYTDIDAGTITPANGTWSAPKKPDNQDWVLVLKKK